MFEKFTKAYDRTINSYLRNLYCSAPEVKVKTGSPLIIFSDLHMGNGRKNDDFKKNAELFESCLNAYYLKKNYTLVLNGDIEELQKFSMESIRKAWSSTYKTFNRFSARRRLIKITGNHDDDILAGPFETDYNETQAVKFTAENSEVPIFIFHGHQASVYYRYLNRLNSVLLRYIINPAGIKNRSRKLHHRKKMRIEHRSYRFSRENRIISIIGHTHRPLFESLSRADSLHFEIEKLLRRYRKSAPGKQIQIADRIIRLKSEYDGCTDSKPDYEPASLMYSNGIPVPCLFNTGCAIGKRGITGIEVTADSISLVHWFDSRVSSRFLFDSSLAAAALPGNPSIFRVVLREDKLGYISDTINLLGGKSGREATGGNSTHREFRRGGESDTSEFIFEDAE